MQISPNVYFKVELENTTSLPQPFITQDNMGQFKIVETAGTSLPFVVLSFYTTDEKVIGYFSSNNLVKVTVGNSENDCKTFTFRPLDNPKKSETSERGWEVVVGGFLGDTRFMTAKGNNTFQGTSLSVIKHIMNVGGTLYDYEFLEREIETNIEDTNEPTATPTNWIRGNETMCHFIMNIALHMDISPSFPLIAIDKYGKLHINDCLKLMESPKWTFVPGNPQKGEILYYNNFNVESHRPLYNLYSGYSKVTQVQKTSSGEIKYVISEDKPVIAYTKKTETYKEGPRFKTNKIQSDNVHKTYQAAFEHNTNKLMALSSLLGELRLVGFYSDLKPTDIVNIKLPKSDSGELAALDGLYIIDSIEMSIDFRPGGNRLINTTVYVTKDNPNNVEDFDSKKKKSLMKLGKGAIQDLCTTISRCRNALAISSRLMDGTFIKYCTNFLINTKVNFLRMFSAAGVEIDFNSQALFTQSMLCMSNNIMNALVNMLFPDFVATTLRDFLIDQPSMRRLLSKYINQYVPFEIQDIISNLVDSLLGTHDALNSIAKANNITARSIPEVATDTVPETIEEPIDIIGEIIREFEVHTRGVDLPFPIINLTESQKLLPIKEIKNYVADVTIENLKELGYMDNINEEEFKEVLLSDDPEETLSFATMATINQNAGYMFMYRYWGTYGPTNETLYAWSYGNNTIYTKTEVITESTRLYDGNYSPYTTKENLYAWTYEGKVVYTETLNIQEDTRLLNDNYSTYTGTSFRVIPQGDTYIVAYMTDEEHYEAAYRIVPKDVVPDFRVMKINGKYEITYKGSIAIRNEEADVNTTALAQLTSYYISKGFKDKYRTLPCTKVINATKNSRLYFVCPEAEKDIKFYINSKREILESFPIDLGYVDEYGNRILYNVYYTTKGYNSNSTMLEVRQE